MWKAGRKSGLFFIDWVNAHLSSPILHHRSGRSFSPLLDRDPPANRRWRTPLPILVEFGLECLRQTEPIEFNARNL